MEEAVQPVVSVAFCERRGQLSKRCYIIESRLEQKLTVRKDFYGKIRPERALQCPSFHSGRMHFTHHSLHPHRFFLGVLHHSRRLSLVCLQSPGIFIVFEHGARRFGVSFRVCVALTRFARQLSHPIADSMR
jgi:hypothetical protein